MRKWLRGESEPNVTDLRALCEMTGIRIEWLASGQGPREAQVFAEPTEGSSDPARALVRERLSAHRNPALGALDMPLLEAVIAAVDEQLRLASLDLPPAKRSALVAAAYDLARGRNAVDADAVARLLRLMR